MIIFCAIPLFAYLFKLFGRPGLKWIPVTLSFTIVLLSYRSESFSLVKNLEFTFLLSGFLFGVFGSVFKGNLPSIKPVQITFGLLGFYLAEKAMITTNGLILYFWIAISFTQGPKESSQKWLLGILPFLYAFFYVFENYFGISELSINSNSLSISNLNLLKVYDLLRLIAISSIFLLPLKWIKDFGSLGDFSNFWRIIISITLLLVLKKNMGENVTDFNLLVLFFSYGFLLNFIFKAKGALRVFYGVGLILEWGAFLIIFLLLLNSPSFAIRIKERFKNICDVKDLALLGILFFVSTFANVDLSNGIRAASLLLAFLSIVTFIKRNKSEAVTL